MNVLYITFGQDVSVHQQAVFSVLTLLRHSLAATPITVITDAPEFYGQLTGAIEIETIDADRLKEWKGKHSYPLRLKIKALEWLAARHPDRHLLYLDADTFCFGDPRELIGVLGAGHHLMHAREGALAQLSTRAEQRMWRQYGGRTFAGFEIDKDSVMYNSGVIGLSAGRALPIIERALRLCDALCDDGTVYWLNEQFSVSVALAATAEMRMANGTIGHYWGNKSGWNERIATFSVGEYLRASDLDEQLARVAQIDFGSTPVYTKSSNTRNKLSAWVDRTFEKHVHAYIPAPGAEVSELSERLTARKVDKPSTD